MPGSFAVSGGAVAFIHSQTAAYIVHFIAVATTATPFASPSSPIHSLSARTHAPSLSLARPLTPYRLYAHTPHTPPYSWKGLHHSYNNGNCRCRRPINRTWTPSSFTEVAGVEVFWISSELCWQKSHSLQALQKLDGRLFCLGFQLTEDISYC